MRPDFFPPALRFALDDALEVPGVASEEMRELDRIVVQETGPTLLQMMENAGRALASVAIERLGGSWRAADIVVLAGGGGEWWRRDLRRATPREPRRSHAARAGYA